MTAKTKIQIMFPMASSNTLLQNSHQPYPTCLIDVKGRPIISHVISNYDKLSVEKKYIFIISKNDSKSFHLEESLKLVTPSEKKIVILNRETQGSACSCLMAIDSLDQEAPLIIANSDQVFDISLNDPLKTFEDANADAGVITFESIHPRWSYVAINDNGVVYQAAEKRPISKHAIAGFYYFKKAKYFFDGAMESIQKGYEIDGKFYIAPTINELILKGLKVVAHRINNDHFHTFFTPERIKKYEIKST
jgi:NDP-sugar pyrophosphorylase family protein